MFGYDDAPHGHGEVDFKDVRVPASNILLGEGRGFEIAQGRLGPGRIHHCMRTIGLAERTLESLCQRAMSRTAFGKTIAEQGVTRQWIAESRMEIDQSRLLTLLCRAHDGHGRQQGSAPRDRDDQGGGAEDGAEAGRPRDPGAWRRRRVSQDFHLAYAYARTRTMRIVDGPDAVHEEAVARLELRKYRGPESEEEVEHASSLPEGRAEHREAAEGGRSSEACGHPVALRCARDHAPRWRER